MPKLGDYIGHLLSEIAIARMQADIESVRIAELYADHPLLRSMPVPRFRMPDVEIDVPVVVKGLEDSPFGESSHGTPPIAEIRKVFDKVFPFEETVTIPDLSLTPGVYIVTATTSNGKEMKETIIVL